MPTAVGVIPKAQIGLPTEYLLDGLLRCGWCHRPKTGATADDGSRWYACVSQCPSPAVSAVPVEQDLLIRAMVRAYVALYQVGRHASACDEAWGAAGQLDVTRAEQTRWRECDVTDRRALLSAAFASVLVDEHGQAHPQWRHEADEPEAPTR